MPDLSNLATLARVVSRNCSKNIQIVGTPGSRGTKFDQLYQGLLDDAFESEEAAAQTLYGTEPQNRSYQQLKYRLERRLISTLFLIDVNQPEFTAMQKAYYSCYKNLAAVKILVGRYARKVGAELAEKTIKKAIHFEFSDIVFELSRELQLHFAYVPGENKKFEYYQNLSSRFFEVVQHEMLAEKAYSDLIQEVNSSRASKIELFEKADRYSSQLQSIFAHCNSYRFTFYAYMVFSLKSELKNDYEENLRVSQKALSLLEKKSHVASKTAFFFFWMKILGSNIHIKNYAVAEKALKKCLNLPPIGSNNWYHALDYAMLLYFHAAQHQKAYETYRTAIEHPGFREQYANIAEQWQIYGAFIELLSRIGKVSRLDGTPRRAFRIQKFLNEVPTYAKDKRGANINILILQVLFLLQQGKYGKIIDRMESLKAYTHRYLRRDETFRSNCFIKMLLTLPQADFHRGAVGRRAQRYWKRLQEVPLHQARQNVELEIIPYEQLWEFTLELLDDKRHRTRPVQ